MKDLRFINENFRFIKRFCAFWGEKCRWNLAFEFHRINLMFRKRVSTCFDADRYENESENDLNAYRVVNEYDDANLKRVFLIMVN
jgi:16S rRNA (cytosine1402-N4)-methyltransferase